MKKTALSLLFALPFTALALPSEQPPICLANLKLKQNVEPYSSLYELLETFGALEDQAAKLDYLNAHLELLPYFKVQAWLKSELQTNHLEVVQWLQQLMENSDLSASHAAYSLLSTATKDSIEARLDAIEWAVNKQPSLLHCLMIYRALRQSPYDLPQIQQFLQQIESHAKAIQWSIQARLLLDALPIPQKQLSKRFAAVFAAMPKAMTQEEALDLARIAGLYRDQFKAGQPQAKEALILLAKSESAFASFALFYLYELMHDDPLYLKLLKQLSLKNPLMIGSAKDLAILIQAAKQDPESLNRLVQISESQSCQADSARLALKKLRL